VAPVMLRTRLYCERLANLSLWMYNIGSLIVLFTLPLGYTQGREYAEAIFPAKVFFLVALCLLTYVLVMTMLNRREPVIYVAVWYVLGGLLWTTLFYPLGNVMWHPVTGAMTGTIDAIWLWFYATTSSGSPRRGRGGALLRCPASPARRSTATRSRSSASDAARLLHPHRRHHLIQAPVPTWLKVVSIADSVGMIIPVATVLVNSVHDEGQRGRVHGERAG
jgi:cytochrome c oxidase cbb3-type subunit 1/cytochrome c oxidase cbb3-type subunit I/II